MPLIGFINEYAFSLQMNYLTVSLKFLLNIPAVNVFEATFFIAILISLFS